MQKSVKGIYRRSGRGDLPRIYPFQNTVTQEAKLIKLLPVELDESGADEKEDSNILMNFEPNPEEALELIIPKYVTSLFYGALVESFASETEPECRRWILLRAMQRI